MGPTPLFYNSHSHYKFPNILKGLIINQPSTPTSTPLKSLYKSQQQQELANKGGEAATPPLEESNKRVVLALYNALNSRDPTTVHSLLNPDLEWWFHGPPSHQFLMPLLTGAADSSDGPDSSFLFIPQSIVSFGSLVLAEGSDPTKCIYWVHAWTLTHGIISHVREYFNTSVTVTRLGCNNNSNNNNNSQSQPSDQMNISSAHCQPLWESSLSNRAGKSVPGLVLAL